MNEIELTPTAEVLIDAYLETALYSRAFRADHGQPPTLASKVHHLRSIVQAQFNAGSRFILEPEYSEYGRVQFIDGETQRSYILRSTAALAIEVAKAQQTFFDPRAYLMSEVTMLVYHFGREGLDLSIAGTHQRKNRRRLEASGPPVFIATWPYTPSEGPPFDQREPFGDLGELGWDESDEGGEQGV